jgi:hypothetical protein
VREVERRMQKVESHNASGERRELPGAPIGVPDSFDEHVRLMFDLQALAFMTDSTRVFSFKMGRDGSGRVYPESGSKAPASIRRRTTRTRKTASSTSRRSTSLPRRALLPYFLEKLKETPDGDGNLLDNTLIIYGSPMGELEPAQPQALPAVPGREGRRHAFKGGLHVKAPDGTPMANVCSRMLHRLGLDDVQSLRRQHRNDRPQRRRVNGKDRHGHADSTQTQRGGGFRGHRGSFRQRLRPLLRRPPRPPAFSTRCPRRTAPGCARF